MHMHAKVSIVILQRDPALFCLAQSLLFTLRKAGRKLLLAPSQALRTTCTLSTVVSPPLLHSSTRIIPVVSRSVTGEERRELAEIHAGLLYQRGGSALDGSACCEAGNIRKKEANNVR